MNKTVYQPLSNRRRLFTIGYPLCVMAMLASFSPAAADWDNPVFDRYLGTATANATAAKETHETVVSNVSVTSLSGGDSHPGWKLNIGIGLTDNIAIEAGYLNWTDAGVEGSLSAADATAVNSRTNANQINANQINSAGGFTIGSIYHYSVSQHFDLNGSVGVFNWDSDHSSGAVPPGEPGTAGGNSGTDFYFGLGGGYQLFDDITLSVEWERYKLDSEKAEVWSIGVDYHFK